MAPLVDDRYMYQPCGWLDIATGDTVSAGDRRARRCAGDAETLVRAVDIMLRAADMRDQAGTRVLHLSAGHTPARVLFDVAAVALRSVGFVVVRADLDLPEEIRRPLLHRHLMLWVADGVWHTARCDGAVAWIRRLTATSPRAHLLVVVKQASGEAGERGSGDAGDAGSGLQASRLPGFPASVRERAVAWGDGIAEAHGGAWAEAVAAGDLERAETEVHAGMAQAAARGEAPPRWTRPALAEILFWQGRLAEAITWLAHAPADDPGVRFWRGLTGWARRARPLRSIGGAPPAYLTVPLQAQSRLEAGDAAGARRVVRSRLADGRGLSGMERMLLHRIAAGCEGRVARDERVSGGAASPGECTRVAQAVRWFGIRRDAMNLLHSVSALLEQVQDADDEFTALRRGCSWVREQPSAEGAGIVASDGTRLIVGEGVVPADLHDPDLQASLAPGRTRTVANGPTAVATAPVRYGGATIGFAVVRGRRDAAEALGGAAAALASACAPALRARLDHLSVAAASQTLAPEILGCSPSIAALREAIARAAATSFPVLIEGESGTGKELVARAVHRLSPRRDRRFTALNCAALTDELVEAELFGHARGAFTGAVGPRAGLFEESHGSTLFMDEVAELSPRAQAKLLRVLQEREIRRVGDHLPRSVDVRVVAATNSPLSRAVGDGKFREDLLFRLAVVRLWVPPLRDRIEDVPLLAQTFWRSVTLETGKRAILSPDALAALCSHQWPGNVRELQNVMASLMLAAPSRGRVTARHVQHVLACQDARPLEACTLEHARAALERRMIAGSLARHGGRCSRAARELGLSRQGLAKKIRRLGLGTSSAPETAGVRGPGGAKAPG